MSIYSAQKKRKIIEPEIKEEEDKNEDEIEYVEKAEKRNRKPDKTETTNEILLREIKRLSDKVDNIDTSDDLELEYTQYEDHVEQQSQMLNISHTQVDSFGDSIELTTKSRLENNRESFQVAWTISLREYHNMKGNRYGKHSKLIPVVGRDRKITKLDAMWFSGSDIKIVEINGLEYYKVRLLLYDIVVKKLLLSRIPTNNGGARQEEINLAAAQNMGNQRLAVESSNVQPMKPVDYRKKEGVNIGDKLYDN